MAFGGAPSPPQIPAPPPPIAGVPEIDTQSLAAQRRELQRRRRGRDTLRIDPAIATDGQGDAGLSIPQY